MMYDTVEEYDEIIGQTRKSIARSIIEGRSRKFTAESSGTEVADVSVSAAEKLLRRLTTERDMLDRGISPGFTLGAGW